MIVILRYIYLIKQFNFSCNCFCLSFFERRECRCSAIFNSICFSVFCDYCKRNYLMQIIWMKSAKSYSESIFWFWIHYILIRSELIKKIYLWLKVKKRLVFSGGISQCILRDIFLIQWFCKCFVKLFEIFVRNSVNELLIFM